MYTPAITTSSAQTNLTEPHLLEADMLQLLQQRQRPAGVYFLPRPVRVRNDHNLTMLDWDRTVVDPSSSSNVHKGWFGAIHTKVALVPTW